MKWHVRKIAIVLSLLLIKIFSYGQWIELPTPFGPILRSNIVLNNGYCYTSILDNKKLSFVKTKDQNNWEKISELSLSVYDYPYLNVENGKYFLFAVSEPPSFAYASNDEGLNWTKILFDTISSQIKFFQPVNSTLIATTINKIYISDDKGLSWPVVKGTGTDTIYGITKISSQQFMVATKSWIFTSIDNGINWDSFPAPYPIVIKQSFLRIFSTSAGIFITVQKENEVSELYRSVDKGKNWSLINNPSPKSSLKCFYVNNNDWWASNNRMYYSSNNGQSWEILNHPDLLTISGSNDTIFLGGEQGFFKTYNKAKSWISGNLGWNSVYPDQKYPTPNYFLTNTYNFDYYDGRIFLNTGNGIYSSNNDGYEWTVHNSSFTYYTEFLTNGNNIGYFGDDGIISNDNGLSWNIIGTDFNTYGPFNFTNYFASANKYIYSIGWPSDTLFRSVDFGLTWKGVNEIFDVTKLKGLNNKLYLFGDESLQVSEDFGFTFKKLEKGLPSNYYISNLFITPTKIFAISNKLYKLFGDTWIPSDDGLYDTDGILLPIHKMTGFDNYIIANYETNDYSKTHLRYSENNGANWKEFDTNGLPPLVFTRSCLSSSSVYISGINAFPLLAPLQIFKSAILTTTNAIPNAKNLSVYPNPSSGQFIVESDNFNLINGKWEITNLLGSVLLSGDYSSSNILDLSSFEAGVYVLLTEIDNFFNYHILIKQ